MIECPLALFFFFSVMTQFFKSGKSKVMVRLSSPVCLSFRHTLFVNCLQSSRNLNKFRKFLFTDSAFLVSLKKKIFFFSLPISYCFGLWFWFSLFSAILLFNALIYRNCSLFLKTLSVSIYTPEENSPKEAFKLSLPESHNLSSTKSLSVFLLLFSLKD